jgi:hypothetical protein
VRRLIRAKRDVNIHPAMVDTWTGSCDGMKLASLTLSLPVQKKKIQIDFLRILYSPLDSLSRVNSDDATDTQKQNPKIKDI